MAGSLGRFYDLDNTKAKTLLGMNFIRYQVGTPFVKMVVVSSFHGCFVEALPSRLSTFPVLYDSRSWLDHSVPLFDSKHQRIQLLLIEQ